jgi:hypothetical protein
MEKPTELKRRHSNNSVAGGMRLECLQFFPRFEPDRFARRDANLFPSARIAADAGFPRLDIEHAETAELDAFATPQRILHGFKYGLYRLFCLGSGYVCSLDDSVDDIEFYHASLPVGQFTATYHPENFPVRVSPLTVHS